MKVFIVIGISLSIFCLSACKGTQETHKVEEKTATNEGLKINPNCISILIDNELYSTTKTENITVLESNIEGNYLYLKYSFSGCESDELNLVWNSMLAKSYPSQAQLKLGYEKTGSCDQIQTIEACFDLKDFVQYKKVYLFINGAGRVLFETNNK